MRFFFQGGVVATLFGIAAAGCGGGGSSGGSTGSTQVAAAVAPSPSPSTSPRPGTPPPPAGTTPPPPPPGPGAPPPPPAVTGTVDSQLVAALARAGIATPQKRPADSQAMVSLGQSLFFDKILSGNRNISCSTCHSPGAATGDGMPLSLGEGATGAAPARRPAATSQIVARNAPSLFAVGALGDDVMFWDGRVRLDPVTRVLVTPDPALNGPNPTRPDLAAPLTTPLAAQAMFPVVTANEMRGNPGENEIANAADNEGAWAAIMARLVGTANGSIGGIDAYRTLFRAAFPAVTNLDDLNFAHAAHAIAAFESQTYAFFASPLDRYLAGDTAALPDAAKQGGLLFTGRARCARCHHGPLLSDLRPHALAVPQLGPGKANGDDLGVALVSGVAADDYRFRTPPLRNVALAGPFDHDGAFGDLTRVLDHYRNPATSLLNYDASGLPAYLQATVDRDPSRNQARLAAVDPIVGNGIPMSDADIQAIVAFLQALTDPAAKTPPPPPAAVASGLPVGD